MTLRIREQRAWHVHMIGPASARLVLLSNNALTLGVLTKADTVSEEERFKRWSTIIAGEDPEHRLAHGYYLTMQSRRSPTPTWEDNLVGESNFFRTAPFWTRLGDKFRRCIGSVQLRKKLSSELSRLIKARCAHYAALLIEEFQLSLMRLTVACA
jgi:hypothetical protein